MNDEERKSANEAIIKRVIEDIAAGEIIELSLKNGLEKCVEDGNVVYRPTGMIQYTIVVRPRGGGTD
jgi:hypothetical protein